MRGSELVRKLRKLGRRRGLEVIWNPQRGKGGHGTLVFGGRRTVIPSLHAELLKSTCHAILIQLGLKAEDLE